MARYRPVDVRLWNDRRFLVLPDDLKLLWMFLLSTPSTLAIPGVIVGGPASLAEQMGWTTERFTQGLHGLFDRGMKLRFEGRVIWLSNALKYQRPDSPNALRGWAKCWDDIPEGDLKEKIWDALRIACKSKGKARSKNFEEWFPKVWGEGYAQPSLELSTPGSGSGSRSETRSRSGSTPPRQGAQDLSPDSEADPEAEKAPVPTLRVVSQVDELVAEIGNAHEQAYETVRAALGSRVPPFPCAEHPQLRAFLENLPSLDGVREGCLHALRVQERRARDQQTTKWFGAFMWTNHTYNLSQSCEDPRIPAPRSSSSKANTQTALQLPAEVPVEARVRSVEEHLETVGPDEKKLFEHLTGKNTS